MSDVAAFFHRIAVWFDNCFAWLAMICDNDAFVSLQSLLWEPVVNNDRLAWGTVAILCGIAAILRVRLLLAASVSLRGFSMVVIFIGQVFGILQYWNSAFQFYALLFYALGSAMASMLDRTDWEHLTGPLHTRLSAAWRVLLYFDRMHPAANEATVSRPIRS
jgi:hypothetical protein